MTAQKVLWHVAQTLPILAAGAWAIACIVTAFNVPTLPSRPSSSSWPSSGWSGSSTSSGFNAASNAAYASFERQRTWLLTLWVGTGLGWFSAVAGVVMYIALGLVDKYVRTRTSHRDKWLKRRKIFIVITGIFRALGATAGIALGAYYATTRSTKLAAASALAFVFAVACIVAIVFTTLKRIHYDPDVKQEQGQGYTENVTQYGQPQGAYGQHSVPANSGQNGWQAPSRY
ncbi:uncharacterized protein B0I36DRAFT_397860 [Microdochium trichocladiopsis]|uniref:Uncharacterized protein n=1 Tax=Microdochium trichocladiopsis TaxID=1682393 RepID=A0A9P8XU25_9PEZI|nr:uncharacterized protein B0I36DRAFT_397860 [Microdochium trichocladiopsis]KAH7014344.1 hypothetical protein B0I36DRAFT_397860 [Microdochium trichocladiopsis]